MNLGGWKRFWTWCQRVFGAGWIHISTYNLMRVHGLEHVEAVDHERPVILVANHRSFFDMYVVSTTLFTKPSGASSFSSRCVAVSITSQLRECSLT